MSDFQPTLHLVKTSLTPEVRCSAEDGTITMSGDSYPENAFDFYSPVLSWTETYLASGKPLRCELHLVYLNTSSIRIVMELFDVMESAHAAGKDVRVNWYFDRENDRVAELAEEFKEDLSLPFEIIGR
jgi:hypothetical protein